MSGKDDLDLDLDLDLGTRSGLGSGFGPRANTDAFPRYMPPNPSLKWPRHRYAEAWDPEMRAWEFVQDFVKAPTWTAGPIQDIIAAYAAQNGFPVPRIGGVPTPADDAVITAQVIGVLDASIDRAERTIEILDQAEGQGALHYWTGLMRISPTKNYAVYLLMLLARKIGEYVAMGLKDHYRMRRPAQVYPWIMPLIDGPDTPSYPSGHSLQGHLISGVVKLALTPEVPPPSQPQPIPYPETARALDVLADRVAYNREVAGVHYRMDSLAGAFGARVCLDALYAMPAGSRFKKLVAVAKTELSDLP
jgi:hypothetical protein